MAAPASSLNGLKARYWETASKPASAGRLAELHAAMHQVASDELPSLHDRLRLKFHDAQSLSEQAKSTALRALAALPEGDCVCLGDFHLFNVLLSVRGPIIIDWTDAACGNPLGDVARTLLLLHFGTASATGTACDPALVDPLPRRLPAPLPPASASNRAQPGRLEAPSHRWTAQ